MGSMNSIKYLCLIVAAALALNVFTFSPSVAQSNDYQALNRQATELSQAGKYAAAIPLAQQALAIREKAVGPNHLDVGILLNNLALLFVNQGRYAEAEPLYKRSLAIQEKTLGPNNIGVATLLNNFAFLYFNLGRYAEAEPLYKRSLAIREKVFGSTNAVVGTSLSSLAQLYDKQGHYSEAELLFKRAQAIYLKTVGPENSLFAASLNSLGELYREQGRYADSEMLYKRSLAIYEKILGRDHPNAAIPLSDLAELYREQGRYADAEPLYKRALAIQEKTLGPEHTLVATTLNNLAGLYRDQGRYADAELLNKRSLAIFEKALGRDHPYVAISLSTLAELYREQGRDAEAEPLYNRALEIQEKVLGRDHPDVATALSQLAGFYLKQNRYADAEPLLKRALAMQEKALRFDHRDVATSLSNLAGLYRDQGRYADAEPLYKRTLGIYEKTLGRDHPYVGTTLNNLAGLYRDQGRYAEALPLVRRTIEMHSAKNFVVFPILHKSVQQNLISADDAFSGSYETVQRISSSAAGSAVSKLAARFAAGTGELAELVRKDQDLSVEAEQLDKALISALSKPPAERNAAAEDQDRKRVDAVKTERDKLQQVFNQRFPDYVALTKPQPLSLKDTQTQLAEDEALIAFDFDAKSYAWIITRTNSDWTELKITAKDLKAQVEALREPLSYEISDPSSTTKLSDLKPYDAQLAYKIYQATFGAFDVQIATKTRLSIVTNGALTSLPPHLLVTKDPTGKQLKDVDWFVRSHAITILPSVTSLRVLRGVGRASSAARPMIAFADPVFSKTARIGEQQKLAMITGSITRSYRGTQLDTADLAERLSPLPGTRDEVKAIASVLRIASGDIRLGSEATETAVKRTKLDQYRIVYFATHGLVAGEIEEFTKTKAEPALAFTMPNNPTELDDGLLQASEIAQLKLNADWVVLSACNTAAEDKPGAEALSGLARAFFYAGARSLIVSHWAVDDRATAMLMVATFQTSSSDPTLSHAQALQKSMLAMIENPTSELFVHPRFWAPFVVVGEPVKLTK